MQVMQSLFNNERNARQMIRWIFEQEPTVPGKVAERLKLSA